MFRAGRGRDENLSTIKLYKLCHLNKKSNLVKILMELIENNPELARDILGRIAIWSGCRLSPGVCPILKSIYFIYKNERKIFEINETEIRYGNLELFSKMIYKRKIAKDEVSGFSPQTINMMARKAEYATHIFDKLDGFDISSADKMSIKKSLFPVLLKTDYKGFLTDDELDNYYLKITPFLNINKDRLLSTFAYTLRNVNRNIYAKILLLVIQDVMTNNITLPCKYHN